MSALEPPAALGLMFPFKEERSRNKERLEASLAALCELELLKQRQESRVLSALCLGDNSAEAPGRTTWTALGTTTPAARFGTDAQGEDAQDYGLKLQTSSLQCTPWGIMASLEQHVAQLKVNTEVKLANPPTVLEDSQPPAGEISSPKEDCLPVEASIFHQRLPRSLSAPNGNGDIEPKDTWLSDLARSTLFADALAELKSLEQDQESNQQANKAETYIFGLIQRKALPPRPTKPRTSLAPDARAAGVVRQSSLCRKDEQQSPKQAPVQVIPDVSSSILVQSQVPERIPSLAAHNLDHQERYPATAYHDEAPPPYHHLQQSVQNQPALYHKTKQVPMVASRSISLEYPSCRVIPAQMDSSNSDPDSPQNFQGFSPAVPKPQQLPPPEEHLVNAEYIPAQPCRASTRAYAHHHSHHHSSGKTSGASKPNRSTYSPERAHQHQEQPPAQSQPSRSRSNAKKSDKNGATRKQGKKACRSQSENSLQRAPERKYNTVERDGAGSGSGSRGSRSSQSKSKKQHHQQQQQQQHGNGHHRRWQSSLELSQDEAEQPHGQTHVQPHPASNQRDQCSRRTRKSRPTHPVYAYPIQSHHHHHHHHSHLHDRHVEYQLDTRPVEDYHHAVQGESESSSSDADSPDSSSLSSDSDESGGLVWPQQLPPQLTHPPPAAAASAAAAAPGAPLQQKAFVKIKASHALKKKILRFRTGSLKVMTTV